MLRTINQVLTICAILLYGYVIVVVVGSGYNSPLKNPIYFYVILGLIIILARFLGNIAYNHLWVGATITFGPLLALLTLSYIG